MHLDHYELETGNDSTVFEFVSEGKKGRIIKVIEFQKLDANLYNLAFGDKNLVTNEFDDRIITDNGDTEKVLATVISAVYIFTDAYPDAWVYATGSTHSRTRLYKMGINRFFEIASTDFEIMGEYKDDWESYRKGGHYEAFAARRKNYKFEL